jgi:hypothetical protein
VEGNLWVLMREAGTALTSANFPQGFHVASLVTLHFNLLYVITSNQLLNNLHFTVIANKSRL